MEVIMTEEQNVNSQPEARETWPVLVIEGGIKVLYKGVWVDQIPFDKDEIAVGVMDPENEIFPDINLRQYRLDGGDPYISRRHARFFRSEDKYYVEDLCRNNSTSLDSKSNIINGEKHDMVSGSRVFISESVVFRFEPHMERNSLQVDPVASAGETRISDEKSADKSSSTEDAAGEKAEKAAGEKAAGEEGKDVEFEQSAEISHYLEVEGQVPLFFKPRNIFTHIIELNSVEWQSDDDGKKTLKIGRRSTEDGIYPDIDLWKFYFNDGDEYIARRHARIFEQNGKFYFQDTSGKGSTWYNVKDDEHRLLKTDTEEACVEISEGDKLYISDSVAFIVHKQ